MHLIKSRIPSGKIRNLINYYTELQERKNAGDLVSKQRNKERRACLFELLYKSSLKSAGAPALRPFEMEGYYACHRY